MNLGSVQRTISKEGSIEGTGLHTGQKVKVFFKPLGVDQGIQFFRDGKKVWVISKDSDLTRLADSSRCTVVGERESSQIQTVEHVLAALAGVGITNVVIDVLGPEMPGFDGSASGFVEFLNALGLSDQNKEKDVFEIKEPIFCAKEKKALAIYPSKTFSVAYTLDYPHPSLRNQKFDFEFSQNGFAKEVAPARTFCTYDEAQGIKKMGFGLGANFQNTLVFSENGPMENTLKFPNECARHKVLDLIGDLNLLGFGVLGRVVGLRSGHALNRQLVKEIAKQRGLK